jgi:hypothetical protein
LGDTMTIITLKIGIDDAKGVKRCITKPCRSVLLWTKIERNPFLLRIQKERDSLAET